MWTLIIWLACQSSKPSDTSSAPMDYVSPLGVTEKRSLSHQSINREYWLHVPDDLPENAPLWIVMHGYSDDAESMMNWSNLNSLSDEKKFVLAYPQGTLDDYGLAFFNVGYAFHANQTVDDLGYIRELVTALQSEFRLSTENVFATGLSNGGDMSYYLACEASDLFRAIAPVAGTMLSTIHSSCTPEGPVPVFEIHGTADDVTLWNGDPNNQDGWGSYLDIPSIMSFWVNHNDLEAQMSEMLDDIDPSDGSQVLFERYFSERSDTEVWLYAVEGGGHDWPGVWGNMDIDSNTEIWRFFDQMKLD